MAGLFEPSALGQMLMTLIAFILVIYIAYKLAWNPISKILEERKEKVTTDLEEANNNKTASEESNVASKKELVQARQKAQEIVTNAKTQSQKEAASIIKNAETEVNSLKKSTQKQLEQEREELHKQMEEAISSLSIDVAAKILQREITIEDQQKFIEGSIARLEAEK